MVTTDLTIPALPEKLQVEVTASCNLRCRMCIVRYRPPYARSASMSFAQFRALLDSLPSVREVVLQGIGEPLLAPDLYEMIAYAAGKGLFVEFNSNATLLTRRAGERLIDAGLGALHLSLDGATAETYEFVRDRARFSQVEANIEGFVRLLRERGAARPVLSLVMVLMQRNLHELPALVERAGRWGIPDLFVQSLSHDFSDAPRDTYTAIAAYVTEQTVLALPHEQVEEVYERARAVAARWGIALRLPRIEERVEPIQVNGTPVGCDWPFRGGYVTYDGSVLPCCMVMGSERAVLGRLEPGRSFIDVWESEPFRAFRRGLIAGEPPAVCRGCSLYRGVF